MRARRVTSCLPELFQKHISKLLEGLGGVVCPMDNVLICGKDEQEHDARLIEVLEWVQSAGVGVTFTSAKCELGKTSLKFS